MTKKRVLDLIFTVPGVLLISPALILVAILIKLDSQGPVIFRQSRVGRYGLPFNVLKFRTMVNDAERIGPSVTIASDARVTRIGRVLRKYKLDEMPQLFNVIKGDMSLVGPRPEMREYVELYPAEKKEKILSLRPGITDNASIEFRNESEILANSLDPIKCYIEEILPTKIALYEQYVENHTVKGDFVIIIRTILAVFAK